MRGVVYLSHTEKHPICIELTELNYCLDPETARKVAGTLTQLAAALIKGADRVESGDFVQDPDGDVEAETVTPGDDNGELTGN
jgi:hypothetical protein